MTFADRVPRYLRFLQYWGTFFIFVFIICCICNYFISSVPRYFLLSNFRGTFLVYTYNMRLNFYSFLWLCTPIFHNFKMSGYACPNFNLFCTTYSLCLLKMYPDISFFLFFGVHILKLPLLFAQHIVCIHQKHTPTFHFSCFLRYTFPNCCSFYTTYGLYPQKNVPRHFFFPFFEVRMPKPPFISHNKYIVQFTQNLSKPLFITSFHKK